MLTFDLEEFDIPEEYGQSVPEAAQMHVTLLGLDGVLSVLDKHEIRATFFTTGHFAAENPASIQYLAKKHEIASHSLRHAPSHEFSESDIADSKRILEAVSGQIISGFRMPRLRPFSRKELRRRGFRYDSSLNPTWLPGRYNLLRANPLPSRMDGLIELPCSTTPWLRFPLFWLSFKNLPLKIYIWLCSLTLKKRGNLMLYFHPWEFADLGAYKLPLYVKKPDSHALLTRLDELVGALKKEHVAFVTCGTFCDYWEKENASV